MSLASQSHELSLEPAASTTREALPRKFSNISLFLGKGGEELLNHIYSALAQKNLSSVFFFPTGLDACYEIYLSRAIFTHTST